MLPLFMKLSFNYLNASAYEEIICPRCVRLWLRRVSYSEILIYLCSAQSYIEGKTGMTLGRRL